MEKYRITVEKSGHGRSIDEILKEKLGLSRALLRKIKREGGVLLNGNPVLLQQRVEKGDTIALEMDFSGQSPIAPELTLLDIVYEDDCILVVNKPAGMLVHPVSGEETGTLANYVMGHWLQQGNRNPVFRPVYRIDRGTSGLVLVSKTHLVHLGLTRQLTAKTMKRVYIALAGGIISTGEGTVSKPIARKPGSIVEREVSPSGSPAVTHYRVLGRLPGICATLLEVTLETGRTHQIRVHLSHIGHPLLGDTLYGGNDGHIGRQALHSYRLLFTHPLTGDSLDLKGRLPGDMKKIINGR